MTESDRDVMSELGVLALGSRLKRLSDTLAQDVSRMYQSVDAGFEPRWFPVFVYLYRQGPTSITELAKGLGVSHPGINRTANELIDTRLVAPYRDRKDKRKRVLALTSLGREKYQKLEPVWRAVRQAMQSAVDEGGGEFLQQLTRLECSLQEQSFLDRFADQVRSQSEDISIRSFEPGYAGSFRQLNEAWIGHYFGLEDVDRKLLSDPEGAIVAPGGDILFAVTQTEKVLGTCALVKHTDETGELAKMAVAEEARGHQIGYRLGAALVERARELGFRKLVLESNRKLTPALTLYRKLGFSEQPCPGTSGDSRCDVYMTLSL